MPPGSRVVLAVLLFAVLATSGCAAAPAAPSPEPGLASAVPNSFRGMALENMNAYFAPLEPVITAAGGTMREAEIVGRVGDDGATSIVAVRVPGVSGGALLDAFVADSRVAIEREGLGPFEVEDVDLAGQRVTRIVVPEMTLYVLGLSDTLFYWTAADEAAAAELLGLLPQVSPEWRSLAH